MSFYFSEVNFSLLGKKIDFLSIFVHMNVQNFRHISFYSFPNWLIGLFLSLSNYIIFEFYNQLIFQNGKIDAFVKFENLKNDQNCKKLSSFVNFFQSIIHENSFIYEDNFRIWKLSNFLNEKMIEFLKMLNFEKLSSFRKIFNFWNCSSIRYFALLENFNNFIFVLWYKFILMLIYFLF